MKYSIIETTWILIGMIAVLFLISLSYQMMGADRTVRYYYIGEGSSMSDQLLYKVIADIDWHADEVAATFTDPDEALKFMKEANNNLNR